MTKRTRKNFSSDFKAKVALEAMQGVKTLNEIGQKFGAPRSGRQMEKRAAGTGIDLV